MEQEILPLLCLKATRLHFSKMSSSFAAHSFFETDSLTSHSGKHTYFDAQPAQLFVLSARPLPVLFFCMNPIGSKERLPLNCKHLCTYSLLRHVVSRGRRTLKCCLNGVKKQYFFRLVWQASVCNN